MVYGEGVGLLLMGVVFGRATEFTKLQCKLDSIWMEDLICCWGGLDRKESLGLVFWGVVTAVAFPGSYGKGTGYDLVKGYINSYVLSLLLHSTPLYSIAIP